MNEKAREELIHDLEIIIRKEILGRTNYEKAIRLADFILERDRKIVEPLVNCKEEYKKGILPKWSDAIDQTLKNAGVEL